MDGVNLLIDDDETEVEVPDRALRGKVAALLAKAAAPHTERIRRRTVGRPYPTFVAPTDVVRAAGLIDDPPPAPAPEPPRTGKGYTLDAWRQFLTVHGIPFDPSDNRKELVAAWDERAT